MCAPRAREREKAIGNKSKSSFFFWEQKALPPRRTHKVHVHNIQPILLLDHPVVLLLSNMHLRPYPYLTRSPTSAFYRRLFPTLNCPSISFPFSPLSFVSRNARYVPVHKLCVLVRHPPPLAMFRLFSDIFFFALKEAHFHIPGH